MAFFFVADFPHCSTRKEVYDYVFKLFIFVCFLFAIVCFLQHFLSEWQDLIDWCKLMEARLTADELASDLASAEMLVDKHQEHMV